MLVASSSSVEIAQRAKNASRHLAVLTAEERNDALLAIHAALVASKDRIFEANARDVATATKKAADGVLSASMVKRLDLSRPGKWEDMLKGILDVRQLQDPIGNVNLRTELDDDLILERVTCPIGALLVIFEARPEVIANISSLAIKSGNSAILKGGKESTESFEAIAKVISQSLSKTAVPDQAIQLVTTRDAVDDLLAQDKYIDLVIPRGSNQLVRYIKSNTKIPVLGHADGLCSIYVHEDADAALAEKVVVDAKTNYPAACNAVETLLVHQNALTNQLPPIVSALLQKGVSLRCDEVSKSALSSTLPKEQACLLEEATPADYDTEFNDLVLAIKTIEAKPRPSDSVRCAIDHINTHGSHHTDAIITKAKELAQLFLASVDSAGVYSNTSTRMADGMRYGFGTEVGISTSKIHARGPVGLEGLTIYKYLIVGDGQGAGDYHDGPGGRSWKHKSLDVGEKRFQSVSDATLADKNL